MRTTRWINKKCIHSVQKCKKVLSLSYCIFGRKSNQWQWGPLTLPWKSQCIFVWFWVNIFIHIFLEKYERAVILHKFLTRRYTIRILDKQYKQGWLQIFVNFSCCLHKLRLFLGSQLVCFYHLEDVWLQWAVELCLRVLSLTLRKPSTFYWN